MIPFQCRGFPFKLLQFALKCRGPRIAFIRLIRRTEPDRGDPGPRHFNAICSNFKANPRHLKGMAVTTVVMLGKIVIVATTARTMMMIVGMVLGGVVRCSLWCGAMWRAVDLLLSLRRRRRTELCSTSTGTQLHTTTAACPRGHECSHHHAWPANTSLNSLLA